MSHQAKRPGRCSNTAEPKSSANPARGKPMTATDITAPAGEQGMLPSDAHTSIIKKNGREEIHLGLDEYKGQNLFNCRVWFQAEDGAKRPGKSGIAFKVELLPQFFEAVGTALGEALVRRLIDPSSGAGASFLPQQPEAETPKAVRDAAAWLAAGNRASGGIVPHLRKAFGLTTPQAITAIRLANQYRARAAA